MVVATPTAAIADLIPGCSVQSVTAVVVLSAPSERAQITSKPASCSDFDPSLLLRATFADVVAQLAKAADRRNAVSKRRRSSRCPTIPASQHKDGWCSKSRRADRASHRLEHSQADGSKAIAGCCCYATSRRCGQASGHISEPTPCCTTWWMSSNTYYR